LLSLVSAPRTPDRTDFVPKVLLEHPDGRTWQMATKKLGDLIYTPESASGEAVSKVESHTPKIEAPEKVKADQLFTIRVTVGPHPNLIEHSIRRIEVFLEEEDRPFNPVMLATMSLTPVYSDPDVKLNVKLKKGGTIHAVEYCNLHGLWEGTKAIKVTE